mgnify:CR=1 FL=1
MAELRNLEDGFVGFDASKNENVFVVCPVKCFCGDNPCQSQLSFHLGSTSTFFCRRCYATKDSAEDVADRRVKGDTLRIVCELRNLALDENASNQDIQNLRRQHGIKETCPVFFELKSIDMHKHTPVESLHTFLLGMVKYLTRDTFEHYIYGAQKKNIYAFIETFDFSSFGRRLLGNFVKHHKSFVGRDFKLMIQFIPIVFYFVRLRRDVLDCWVAAADVAKLLYMKETSAGHQESLKTAISDLISVYLELDEDYYRSQSFIT